MISGQSRFVQYPAFHRVGVNPMGPIDPNVDLAEEPRSHYPCKARHRGGEEDEDLFRGTI